VAKARDVDAMRYRRSMALGTLVLLVVFGGASALQSEIFQVARDLAAYGEIYSVPLWARLVANLTAAALVALGLWFLPISPSRRTSWLATIGGVTIGAVLVRGALQLLLGVYPFSQLDIALVDVIVGLMCVLFSLAVGVALAEAFKRVRTQERSASRQALRASSALDALQNEELRVRREVAEGLHGTVQQRLLLLGVRFRRIIEDLPLGTPISHMDLASFEELEREINEIREYDVREMSQLLYPEGLKLGLLRAVRMMLRRVPSSIRVEADIDETVIEYDDPEFGRIPQPIRLVVVRLLEEAVSNALRHGNASHIAVSLKIEEAQLLTLFVDDDGSGVPDNAVFSGLNRLRERLDAMEGRLELGSGALGGARLSASVPLRPSFVSEQESVPRWTSAVAG